MSRSAVPSTLKVMSVALGVNFLLMLGFSWWRETVKAAAAEADPTLVGVVPTMTGVVLGSVIILGFVALTSRRAH